MRDQPDRTGFVGREDDLARLRALLSAGERVITVVGSPGIGKSRLGLELVRDIADRDENGHGRPGASQANTSAFCALAQALDVEGICRGVSAGLGVSLPAMGSPIAQLARIFVDRPVKLLVLDNVEQVLGPTREMLAMWRDFAPETSFVMTSRERLQLAGEVVYELASLGRSARGDGPSEAVELLLVLVARAGKIYEASDPELASLARIAERLEGVPLALELVAPRVALLGARTVEKLFAEPSDLLALSPLRTTLEWSWSLLTADEQRALARASVFVSGFNVAAAQAVLGSSALDLIQALRQKSLLVVSGDRFGYAFSVRDLGAEKLDEMGQRDATEEAHARWFAEWVSTTEERADQPDTLRELAFERENLVAAFERSLRTGTVDGVVRALRLASGLHALAWAQGPFDGYEPLLTRAIEAADRAGIESAIACWALASRGQARRRLGRRDEAAADLERSVEIAHKLGDRRLEGRALCRLGTAMAEARRLTDAAKILDQALALARENDDRIWEAYCLYALGLTANELGETQRASGLLDRASRLFADVGARGMVGHASTHLATVFLSLGAFEQAERCFGDAASAHRDVGNTWWETLVTCGIATLHFARGEIELALGAFDLALPVLLRVGDERSWAVYSALRALAVDARGDKAKAKADLAHAVDRIRGRGDVRSTIVFLAQLGGIEAELDDIEAAERSLAEAEDLLAGSEVKAATAILQAERAILDLSRARAADRRGDHPTATMLVARAQLAFAEVEGGDRERPSLERSFYYVRLSFERARRALAHPGQRNPATSPTTAITIENTGRWLVTAEGQRHSLARKVTLQRLLRRLVDARNQSPGTPVSSEELIALGWPDERASHEASLNRLRVAIARLRQLGLEPLLVGQRGGYLLDPDVPLETR